MNFDKMNLPGFLRDNPLLEADSNCKMGQKCPAGLDLTNNDVRKNCRYLTSTQFILTKKISQSADNK